MVNIVKGYVDLSEMLGLSTDKITFGGAVISLKSSLMT